MPNPPEPKGMDFFKKAVLVVIDMQNGFVWPTSRPAVPEVKTLVQAWRRYGGPVVFTQFVNLPGSPFERLVGWNGLRSSPEIDICEELRPEATCVIQKHFYSAFRSDFDNLVRSKGWSIICLCGSDTDSCVLKTAVDAFEMGYTPYVFREACSTHAGEDAHNAALRMLTRFIGKDHVLDSSTFFARISTEISSSEDTK